MSFRSTMILVLVIVLLAAGAGSGAYLYFSRKNAEIEAQYAQVVEMMTAGEYEPALEAINQLATLNLGGATTRNLQVARVKALMELERLEEAGQVAEAFLERHGNEPQAATPRLALGIIALKSGDYAKAEGFFQTVLATSPPDAPARLEAEVGLARILAAQRHLLEAQKNLLALLDVRSMPEDLKAKVKKTLGEVNLAALFSRVTGEQDEIYHIQRGDSLMALSNKYGVTMAVLSRKNNIHDPRNMSVGQRLIIPHNEFSIEVDRFNNTLTVYNFGRFFKEYPIRTGMYDYMTPLGEFTIQNKKINPQWTDPKTGRVFPGGHPDNELGTRWMAFKDPMLGIHGTIVPESIGLYTSNGCIGMLTEDVEELHDIIPLRTPMVIKGERNPDIERRSAQYLSSREASAPIGV